MKDRSALPAIILGLAILGAAYMIAGTGRYQAVAFPNDAGDALTVLDTRTGQSCTYLFDVVSCVEFGQVD